MLVLISRFIWSRSLPASSFFPYAFHYPLHTKLADLAPRNRHTQVDICDSRVLTPLLDMPSNRLCIFLRIISTLCSAIHVERLSRGLSIPTKNHSSIYRSLPASRIVLDWFIQAWSPNNVRNANPSRCGSRLFSCDTCSSLRQHLLCARSLGSKALILIRLTNPTSAIQHAIASPSLAIANAISNPSATISQITSTAASALAPSDPAPLVTSKTSPSTTSYIHSILPNSTSNAASAIAFSETIAHRFSNLAPGIKSLDCYDAVGQILMDLDALIVTTWGRKGTFRTHRSWIAGNFAVSIDSNDAGAEDTFQLMLIAQAAAFVITQCVEDKG